MEEMWAIQKAKWNSKESKLVLSVRSLIIQVWCALKPPSRKLVSTAMRILIWSLEKLSVSKLV